MSSNQIKQLFKQLILGIYDSFQIFNIFSLIFKSQKLFDNIKNCILLNCVIVIGSVLFYNTIFEKIINLFFDQSQFTILNFIGKNAFIFFWLIPVYIICNVLTAFWIDEIYFETLELVEKSKDITVQGQDLVTVLSNQIERILIVVCFAILISVFNLFPVLLPLKYFTISILNSLYVFEYILLQKYIRSYKSIMYFIEDKILYFFGFGLLLTVIVNIINSVIINSAIFLTAFPIFLIVSVKVNSIRFNENEELKTDKLIFMYPIAKMYDLGIKFINFAFFKIKNRNKLNKNEALQKNKNINN